MTDDKDKLGPPPIDPLSNAAWSRVERGVLERLDAGEPAPKMTTPSRRWPWLAVPLVVAAAAAAAIVLVRSPASSTRVVAGTTAVQPTDEPSRVVAGDTPSTVSFGDALLTLSPRAAIVMAHELGAPSVMIDRGSTTFEVAPRNGRPAFVVRAADVVVRVVGTRFTVARSDERVDVSVDHGIVDVQYKAQVTRVGAGQHWTSDEATTEQPPEKPTPSVDERAQFEHFSAIEAKNPRAALDGYLELAKSRSTWAPVALFAAGRLATDKKDRRAKQLLEQYLKRFPSGANAADARDLLDHLRAR
ncbi:MAG TPA: FecR domain-containing protein [Kofleriaceae bacterium]